MASRSLSDGEPSRQTPQRRHTQASHALDKQNPAPARRTSGSKSSEMSHAANNRRMLASRRTSKKPLLFLFVALLLVLGFADYVMNHDKAYTGVRIGAIDCGGKTAEEIISLLESTYGSVYEEREVYVFVSEDARKRVEQNGVTEELGNEDLISVEEAREQRLMWVVSPETVSASFDVHASAQKAVEEAHGLSQIFSRLQIALSGVSIDPVFNFGDAYRDFVNDVNATVGKERVDYDIWFEDGICYVYMGSDGVLMNDASFQKDLVTGFLTLSDDSYALVAVPEAAPVRINSEMAHEVCDTVNAALADGANFVYEGSGWNATPSTVASWINTKIEKQDKGWALIPFVDPERARTDLLSHVKQNSGEEAIQVRFSVDDESTVTVHADTTGVIPLVDDAIADLDAALFGKGKNEPQAGALAADGEAVTVAINSTAVPTEMSFEDALHYGVIGEISSFTTSYTYGTSTTESRNFNIHLAADILNNSICPTDGTWSFHDVAGECNEERGFKEAGVIEEGVYSTAFGGGICQVATTVFNAVYEAGYSVNRRYNHTIYNSSYPDGRDAAVSWPDLDLIWSNDTASDILLTTSHTEGTITVTLWGVSPERKVSSYVSTWEEGDTYKKKYVLNTSLAPKAYRVKTKGSDGHSVYVERTVTDKDGEQVSFQRFSSYYDAVDEIIEHGEEYEIPDEDEEKAR